MGDEGIPLVKKWTAIGKLDLSNPEEIPAGEGRRRQPILSGFILQTYWNLLDAEFKPKAGRNKILQVPASSVTSVRRPTPMGMRMSAKQGQPSKMGRMNVAAAVKGAALDADFFDERGLPKTYEPPKMMNVLSGRNPSEKPVVIEFGCGLTPLSIDRKLSLMTDTGADANAINKKTFNELFPDVESEESTFLLQNFDKQLVKPIGPFRCFL